MTEEDHDPFAETRRDKSIASRQNEYQQKRLTARQISPDRIDPFAGKCFKI
jgi:splicing factor 3B subunit 1